MATERDPTARLKQLSARPHSTAARPTASRPTAFRPTAPRWSTEPDPALPASRPVDPPGSPLGGAVAGAVRGWVPTWADPSAVAPSHEVQSLPPIGRHRSRKRATRSIDAAPGTAPPPADEPPDDEPPPAEWFEDEQADGAADHRAIDRSTVDHRTIDHGGAEITDDPVEETAPAQRVRRPALRSRRLRDRWIPEPLQHARVDPGRRGSLLLSVVAAAAAVIAAIGVWSHSAAGSVTNPPSTIALPVVSSGSSAVSPMADAGTSGSSAVDSEFIVVSVTGAVVTPGIVTLPAGSRVADAIAAAGGALPGTDYTGLNLATRLADGDSVVVGGALSGVASASTGPVGGASTALVNLNTADQTMLETLPGVGPVMAGNILSWRDANGGFTSVDQLQEISGIGPTRYATLAPLVTV